MKHKDTKHSHPLAAINGNVSKLHGYFLRNKKIDSSDGIYGS